MGLQASKHLSIVLFPSLLSCEQCETFKNIFFHRTPSKAAIKAVLNVYILNKKVKFTGEVSLQKQQKRAKN